MEHYQALRDSAPCLSRAATPSEGYQIGAWKRRAPENTILSQPYRRRVSTDRLNREGSQLAASLESEPGPTPAGKTLPHSYPETGFRRGGGTRYREAVIVVVVVVVFTLTDRASTIPSNIRGCQSGTWSQRGTKVNGSHHGDNPLLRPTGSKSRQKVMRLYKRWHRPIGKRFIKLPLLHIESSLDRLGLMLPTDDQRSQQQIGQTRSNQFFYQQFQVSQGYTSYKNKEN